MTDAILEALALEFEGAEHVNWTGQEVADHLRRKMTGHTFPVAQPVGMLGRENDAFHRALRKYPDAFEALHSFWNDAFAGQPQHSSAGRESALREALKIARIWMISETTSGFADDFKDDLAKIDAALAASAISEPIAWLDMRSEPTVDWTKRIVATNPEFVQKNGPENFAQLYLNEPQPPRVPGEEHPILKHCDELYELGLNDGWNGAVDECAKLVEQRQENIKETSNGSERYLAPRKVGNQLGLAYVNGLRSLAVTRPAPQEAWKPIDTVTRFTRCEMRGIYADTDGDGLFAFMATHWRPEVGK